MPTKEKACDIFGGRGRISMRDTFFTCKSMQRHHSDAMRPRHFQKEESKSLVVLPLRRQAPQ